MRTIVFCFALFAVYLCFGESITHPIQKLPWGSEFGFAFTVSDLNNSTNINSEEKLFNSIEVYTANGKNGYYASQHGPYVPFSFSTTAANNFTWHETKQVAFFSEKWNNNKLSAFVKQEEKLLFVDLETDIVLAEFPLIPVSTYSQEPISIMVYDRAAVVINCSGIVNIYKSISDVNNVRSVMIDNNHSQQYDILGRKAGTNSKGLIILKDNNTTIKAIK